ncbi:FUSC family protein [Thomasclavelia cocleata]|uniref:FUSC family protein n=1 Tax=Thomasclavelia cocleata TaxID=69824 RepID=UPI00258F02CE|nr:FUSC family protein [Thomasclavelia cocleata]
MAFKNKFPTSHLILFNAFRFIINVGFVYIFQLLFGVENILPGVAIGVGFTMLSINDFNLQPWTMFFITVFLYTLSGFVGQSALMPIIPAFIINFLFVILIILLINEPQILKSNISFLLCFVFAQSTSVSWNLFNIRLLSLFCGSLFVGACIIINWYRKGYGKNGRNLKEQILLCQKNKSYMFRMAFGISIAMMIGMILKLKKPLWISIVVMSLTQLEFNETVERIKHRFIGTMVGVILFFIFFQLIIPSQYAIIVVMLLGYIGFFFPDYKYKQIINTISALNASLVLLDTKTAITNRIICLISGIIIVLSIYYITKITRYVIITLKQHKLKQRFY